MCGGEGVLDVFPKGAVIEDRDCTRLVKKKNQKKYFKKKKKATLLCRCTLTVCVSRGLLAY